MQEGQVRGRRFVRSRARCSGRVTRPDEAAVVFSSMAGIGGFAGEQVFDALPLFVSDLIASGGHGFSSRDRTDASISVIVITP